MAPSAISSVYGSNNINAGFDVLLYFTIVGEDCANAQAVKNKIERVKNNFLIK
jgi:hypothetical protein